MFSDALIFALLSTLAAAAPQAEKRAPQAASPQDFTSAVSQLISLYIPASAATPIGSALLNAASASGPIDSVVLSALAAPTPPAFLTAIPSQYQPNIVSLESAISALRGVASTGINAAPVYGTNSAGQLTIVSTKNAIPTTDSAGSSIVVLTGTGTNSAGSTISGVTATFTSSNGSSSASQPSGAVVTTDSKGATITGLAVTTTNSASSTITSLTTTFPSGSSGTASTTGTSSGTATVSSSSSGSGGSSAAPSSSKAAGVPVALAPGAGGLLGLLAFLLAL